MKNKKPDLASDEVFREILHPIAEMDYTDYIAVIRRAPDADLYVDFDCANGLMGALAIAKGVVELLERRINQVGRLN